MLHGGSYSLAGTDGVYQGGTYSGGEELLQLTLSELISSNSSLVGSMRGAGTKGVLSKPIPR